MRGILLGCADVYPNTTGHRYRSNCHGNRLCTWSEVNGFRIQALKPRAILARTINKPISNNTSFKLGASLIVLVNEHTTEAVFFKEHLT